MRHGEKIVRKIGVHHGIKPLFGRSRLSISIHHGASQLAQQVAHGRFHQPFLGAEVIVDRRGRGTGLGGDLCHGNNTIAALVHGHDGGFDQLFIADVTDTFSAHAAVLRHMGAGFNRCYVGFKSCTTI